MFLKLFPPVIITASILLGIIHGLTITVNESQSNSLWGMVNYLYMINKLTESNDTWLVIVSHNILWSFICGILGLLSGGVFSTKFLFNWWSMWVLTLKTHTSVTTWLFVLLESIGMTGIVLSVIFIGFSFLIKRRVLFWQILTLFISIMLPIIGAVIEEYDITNFVN